jgi:hypothetical protein
MKHPHPLIGRRGKDNAYDEYQAKEQFSHLPLFNLFLLNFPIYGDKDKEKTEIVHRGRLFALYLHLQPALSGRHPHTPPVNPLQGCKKKVALTKRGSLP